MPVINFDEDQILSEEAMEVETCCPTFGAYTGGVVHGVRLVNVNGVNKLQLILEASPEIVAARSSFGVAAKSTKPKAKKSVAKKAAKKAAPKKAAPKAAKKPAKKAAKKKK